MDLGSYTSDRMFRLMGSGAMCLAYAHKDIEREFINFKHLVLWSDLNELEFYVETFLKDEVSRLKIETQGSSFIHTFYTWPARMKQLKEMI